MRLPVLQNFFFTAEFIAKKIQKFFTANFIAKTFRNVFTANFIEKNFPKFLIVNFRLLKNFLLLNSLQNKFENFLQSISLKKISKIFQKIRKKHFCLKKKKRSQGGCSFFPSKIRHHLSLGFDIFLFFEKKMFLLKNDFSKKLKKNNFK